MSMSDLKWQLHDERRARTGSALDVNAAAQLLDDAANDVQPEPEAVVPTGCHRALERLEYPPVKLGRDPKAVVGHFQMRAGTFVVGRHANDHGLTLAVLECI